MKEEEQMGSLSNMINGNILYERYRSIDVTSEAIFVEFNPKHMVESI